MKSEHTNPLAVTLPYNFSNSNDYPTEVLANRFQAWRYIIKDIVSYLKEYASVQEEIVRQQIRLQQAVGISANSIAVTTGGGSGGSHSKYHHSRDSNNLNREVDVSEINRYFLPIGNGSIQDLPTLLTKYHQQNVASSSKTLKELNHVIIPKLEELRKDLLIKIKEIKNLQGDFKTELTKEIAETKALLNQYYQSIELSNKLDPSSSHSHFPADSNERFKYDPFLVKLKLDKQIRTQLQAEKSLYDAYANLQESGRKLESIIVIELQNYLSNFLNSLVNEHSSIPDFLVPNLSQGFLSKESTFEWDSFIAKNIPSPSISVNAVGNSNSSVKNGTFIDLNFHARKFDDLVINNYNSPLNLSIREGSLERRSKFLKNYSKGWYVLTCNFLHEFKSSDRKRDQVPVLSISLDSCQVSDHSKNDGKPGGTYKFILSSKSTNGLMHRNQNWVFRSGTYKDMIDWYNDIKSLTSLATPASRARYLSKKMNLTNLNPNLVQTQSKASRTSSIMSTGTNAKSIRTLETGQSRRTGTTSENKLGSTFSNTTNYNNTSGTTTTNAQNNHHQRLQSPKLNHMINSDGTIITPVESHDRQSNKTPITSTPNGQGYSNGRYQEYQDQSYHLNLQPQTTVSDGVSSQYQYHQQTQPPPPQQPQQTPQNQGEHPQYQIPTTSIQQPTPQQPNQQPVSLPPNFINFQPGYIVNQNGQQVQQFYDPIQQQYYTITQQPNQGPQPQYFPTSPQPQPQQPGYGASSPQPNQGYFYIPQQQQPQQPQQPDYNFGGQLPYPAHSDHPVSPDHEHPGEAESPEVTQKEPKEKPEADQKDEKVPEPETEEEGTDDTLKEKVDDITSAVDKITV